MCLKVKDRFAPILSQILGLNIEATQADLKSVIKPVIEFFNFKKILKKREKCVLKLFSITKHYGISKSKL